MQKIDVLFRLCIICVISQTFVYTDDLDEMNDAVQLATNILNARGRSKRESLESLEDKYGDILSKGEVPDSIVCPKFQKPNHGIVRCGGRMCLIQCNTGFMQSKQHAFVYTCNEETKQWTSIPKNKMMPWPDCEKDPYDMENKR